MFKQTTILLDKERNLKLTFYGINQFQEVTGTDILALDDLQLLSPRELQALIWVCLLWEDKELQIEDIPDIIAVVDATELMTALLDCILNSMPEAKPDADPLAVTAEESIGNGSGPSAFTTSGLPKFLS